MIEYKKDLTDKKLDYNENFQFKCHSGLECFNWCCQNKRLNLYPYDMLQLRHGLKMSSEQILEQYIDLEIDPQSGWPLLRIKLKHDGICPFVSKNGCSIYEHRPTCCRMFPLTRAVALKEDNEFEEIFYITRADNCLGYGEQHTLNVKQWIEDQQLSQCHEANNRIMKFYLHPKRKRPMELSDKEMHAIIMALFNLDIFFSFIQQKEFRDLYDILQEQIEQALKSDVDLLNLGQDWLIDQLFGGIGR